MLKLWNQQQEQAETSARIIKAVIFMRAAVAGGSNIKVISFSGHYILHIIKLACDSCSQGGDSE